MKIRYSLMVTFICSIAVFGLFWLNGTFEAALHFTTSIRDNLSTLAAIKDTDASSTDESPVAAATSTPADSNNMAAMGSQINNLQSDLNDANQNFKNYGQ